MSSYPTASKDACPSFCQQRAVTWRWLRQRAQFDLIRTLPVSRVNYKIGFTLVTPLCGEKKWIHSKPFFSLFAMRYLKTQPPEHQFSSLVNTNIFGSFFFNFIFYRPLRLIYNAAKWLKLSITNLRVEGVINKLNKWVTNKYMILYYTYIYI